MADRYSEPTKDVVMVIILLVIACIFLGIGLGGLYYLAPGGFFSTSAAPAKTK